MGGCQDYRGLGPLSSRGHCLRFVTVHIILIDPLEKLQVKKDSTLLLALNLKELGQEVTLLFEGDLVLFHATTPRERIFVHDFEGSWNGENFSVESFTVGQKRELVLHEGDTIHMRLDPPFDSRYLRFLWVLKLFEDYRGLRILNAPGGILLHNEKLTPLADSPTVPTFVGMSGEEFLVFCRNQRERGVDEVVVRPMDLFQGLGVEKVAIGGDEDEIRELFLAKVVQCRGPLLAQPFFKEVYSGEVRSIYYKDEEMGSILKIPPRGDFLANVAQGASVVPYELTKKERDLCERISKRLAVHGVDWTAFDLLGGHISEVNITCPGLLVEVSRGLGENVASKLCRRILA